MKKHMVVSDTSRFCIDDVLDAVKAKKKRLKKKKKQQTLELK